MTRRILNKKSILNIVTCVTGLFFAASANAMFYPPSVKNVYFGGQIGWGSVHQPDNTELNAAAGTTITDIDTALTGRIFAGYQFIDYAAVEFGYTLFGNMNVGATSSSPFYINGIVQSYSLDAVIKGIWTVLPRFHVYGKLGAAFLNEYERITISSPFFDDVITGTDTSRKILPTFTLGMDYYFLKQLSCDLSWMHIQAVGNTTLQNTDFASIGLTYHIG